MPTFRPDIKPIMLRWARERAGLRLEDVEETFSKYRLWEEGAVKPTFRQLESIAVKTRTPLGFFFLDEPPLDVLPIPDFRIMKEKSIHQPSVDLLDTVNLMLRRQGWLRDYLIDQGASPLSFVGSASVNDSHMAISDHIRSTLGIETDWANKRNSVGDPRKFLKEAAESAGITVVINGVVGNNTRRKLRPQEFRGFVLSDNYAPLMFVNGSDAKGAQVFTIAHELCHVWINEGGVTAADLVIKSDSTVEQFCNKVAAELTVPEQILRALWVENQRASSTFEHLAKHFKVSPIVVARRAWDMELVSRNDFFSFYEDYQGRLQDLDFQSKKTSTLGGDFFVNQGYRIGETFFSRVADAVKGGQLLYRDAYRLTGLKSGSFEEYANRLGYTL